MSRDQAGIRDALAIVRDYRAQARAVVRGSLPERGKLVALVRLSSDARREPDAGEWAARAVAEESLHYIRTGEVVLSVTPVDPSEHEATTLRRKGYKSCPTCRCTLMSDLEIDRRHQLRRDQVDEIRIREEALHGA